MDNEYEDSAAVAQRIKKLEQEFNELDKRQRSIGGYLNPQESKRRIELQSTLTELRVKQKKLVNIRKSFENNIYIYIHGNFILYSSFSTRCQTT